MKLIIYTSLEFQCLLGIRFSVNLLDGPGMSFDSGIVCQTCCDNLLGVQTIRKGKCKKISSKSFRTKMFSNDCVFPFRNIFEGSVHKFFMAFITLLQITRIEVSSQISIEISDFFQKNERLSAKYLFRKNCSLLLCNFCAVKLRFYCNS